MVCVKLLRNCILFNIPDTQILHIIRLIMTGQVLNRFRILLAEKEYRDRQKYSYVEIQTRTGIAVSTLSNWATNKTKRYDAVTIAALCEFLDCSDTIELANKIKSQLLKYAD